MKKEKQCKTCEKTLPLKDFYKLYSNYTKKNGKLVIRSYHTARCKECHSAHIAEIRQSKKKYYKKKRKEYLAIPENRQKFNGYAAKYQEANKEKIRERQREYYHDNKEYYNAKSKKWRLKHRDKVLDNLKKYYQANKKQLIEKQLEYYYKNRDQILLKAKERREKNKIKNKK